MLLVVQTCCNEKASIQQADDSDKPEPLPGDLPQLDAERSPFSDSWNDSVAICACMLKENVTDVREWLLYHRCAIGPLLSSAIALLSISMPLDCVRRGYSYALVPSGTCQLNWYVHQPK
jgi:hypothetical protein